MKVGNRSPRRVLRALLEPDTYRAGGQMLVRYPDLRAAAKRYVGGGGDYPYRCRVRTPIGVVSANLHSPDDMLTMNEVFCRQDYRTGTGLGVAIDIGSNIGISALYFLSRNQHSQVYCWEPDPKNVERLRENLAGLEERYEIEEAAVALESGTAPFGVEPVGRYGSLELSLPTGHPATEVIEVTTVALGEILEEVLAKHGTVDLLKIDVEGSEEKLVSSIDADHLSHINTIVYETDDPQPYHLDRFRHRFSSQTNRLDALTP